MANELNIALPTSGLTVTAQRYQSGSAVGSAISLTEVGSSGFYTGTMTGTAGTYQLAFISAGANVGSGSIVWSGTAEVPVSTLTTGDLPSVPSVSDIRTELAVELGRLDASVSSRLAGSSYTAPTTPPTAAEITTAVWAAADKTGYSLTSAERTAIAAAVESSILNEADGQAVLNAIVGAIGNTNLSEVSLVAAVRADLERAGGKLDSIPTTAAPSASAVASATRTELSTELSRIDQSISSRLAASSYTAPANSDIAAIKAKTDNLPASPAATGDIPSANITAIKAKTDQLNTDRLANVATTNIVGTLLAQANS